MRNPFIVLLICTALAPALAAQERVLGGEERQSVALTLYGAGPGLVQETRRVFLAPGEVALSLAGVSAQIQPETLRVATAEGVTVLSQGLELSPLSRQTLLERHLGRSLTVARIDPATGTEHRESATLLSAEGGTAVFRVGEGIEVEGPNSPWRLIFGDLAGDVGPHPALALDLAVSDGGEHELSLTYLSGGLSWEAHYVATLNPQSDALDLLAWAALGNTSGVDFAGARVQLVAGEVNRAAPSPALRGAAMEALSVTQAREETAFEYHLYTLERPVSLVHPQTRLVPLLAVPGLTVDRAYRVSAPASHHGARPGPQVLPVRTVLRLQAPPQRPLPGGIVRFYQGEAGTGGEVFLGEDRLPPTPAGADVALELGTSFDLQARRRQVEFRRIAQDLVESTWELTLANARPSPATVDVVVALGGDWRIIEESHPHEPETAHQVRWQVSVPARGEARLRYRVQVR